MNRLKKWLLSLGFLGMIGLPLLAMEPAPQQMMSSLAYSLEVLHQSNKGDPDRKALLLAIAESDEKSVNSEYLFDYAVYDSSGNVSKKQGFLTPLGYASLYGCGEVVQLLIRKGALPNKKDTRGNTPLYYAAKKGHLQIAQLLIEKGAEICHRNKNGNTPLRAAHRYKHEVMINFLGCHVPLLLYPFTTIKGPALSLKEIIGQRVNGEWCNTTCYKNLPDDISSLIAAEITKREIAVKNVMENNPSGGLRSAIDDSDFILLRDLISIALDVNETYGFNLPTKKGYSFISTESLFTTPLGYASYCGYLEAAKVLLKAGADVNRLDKFNFTTPLILASMQGHKALVNLLLAEKQIEVNKIEYFGRAALYYAARNGHTAIGQLLEEALQKEEESENNVEEV